MTNSAALLLASALLAITGGTASPCRAAQAAANDNNGTAAPQQTAPAQTAAPAVSSRAARATKAAPLPAGTAPRRTNSVMALLQLIGTQIAVLDRAYEGFARVRVEQEARITGLQNDLSRAQTTTALDETRAVRLVADIGQAQQQIAQAFVRARAEAVGALSPEQRAKLAVLQAENPIVTDDKYRHLLLLPLDALFQVRVDADTVKRLAEARREGRSLPDFRVGVGISNYGYGFGVGYGGLWFGADHYHMWRRYHQRSGGGLTGPVRGNVRFGGPRR
jgi:hypothetical protein